MKVSLVAKLMPAVVAGLAAALLAGWLALSPQRQVDLRLPGADRRSPPPTAATRSAAEGGTLVRGEGTAADLPGAWPQFRGPDRTGVSPETISLPRQWPEGGPKRLWSVDVGEGHAGAAVLNGRVYVLDYDRDGSADVLRCMSLADGRDIWRYSYPVRIKRNHGMSRTIPAVSEQFAVSLGPKCHVLCVDAISGERRWMIDLVREYGTRVPPWYAGQCPLIEDGRVILAPGGDAALLVAVELGTGKVVWRTPNPNGWKMTHSSIVPVTVGGRRVYVYCASGGIVGVDATDGTLLWQTAEWKISIATVPSPMRVGDGRLFFSGGYGAGSLMAKLPDASGQPPEPLFRLPPGQFGSAQQTPILYEGHIYGVRPDGQLVCLSPDGEILWTSGVDTRFGLGPYLIADGLIFVLEDHGELRLAEATPAGYNELARAKVLEGPDAWGPMAIVGGRLLARDLNRMVCLDVRAGVTE